MTLGISDAQKYMTVDMCVHWNEQIMMRQNKQLSYFETCYCVSVLCLASWLMNC